jgi:hypothetical protein
MKLIYLPGHLHIFFLASIAYTQCWSISSDLPIPMGISAGVPRTANPGAAKITQKAR